MAWHGVAMLAASLGDRGMAWRMYRACMAWPCFVAGGMVACFAALLAAWWRVAYTAFFDPLHNGPFGAFDSMACYRTLCLTFFGA